MLRKLLALVALALSLSSAAVASAASWSPPVDVFTRYDTVFGNLGIGFDARGRGLVSWNFATDPLHASLLFGQVGVRAITASGLSGVREGPRGSPGSGPPVFFGREGVAVLHRNAGCTAAYPEECDSDGRGEVGTLTVSDAGATAMFARYVGSGGTAMTGDARGRLAVAYSEQRKDGDVLWLRERGAGTARFGRRVRLARGATIGDVAMAYGGGGRLLVAFVRRERVVARLRRGSAGGFDAAQDLGSARSLQSLVAALSPAGHAAVAFRRSRVVPKSDPAIVQPSLRAAVRRAAATRFASARILDVTPSPYGSDLRLVAAGDGGFTLVWTSGVGAATVAQSRAAPGHGFGSPTTLAAGYLGDVAVRSDGTRIVVVSAPRRVVPNSNGIVASDLSVQITPPGGAGTIESVLVGEETAQPVVAFDPASGQPTIAWVGRYGIRMATRRP